jgi:hypothetical protein
MIARSRDDTAGRTPARRTRITSRCSCRRTTSETGHPQVTPRLRENVVRPKLSTLSRRVLIAAVRDAAGEQSAKTSSILWRRLDRAGDEASRIEPHAGGWRLAGTAVFEHERQACRLDYAVLCDPGWRTVSTRVDGWLGDREVKVEILAGGHDQRRWRLNGSECSAVAGCTDVDLNFSPSTNLLPIRRLNLAVGSESRVRAAWLRFPGFELEPLEQVYRRIGESTYRYESASGRFVADLEVNELGFVMRYPGFCEAVTAS